MNTFLKFISNFMILRRVYKSSDPRWRTRCKELKTKMMRLSPQSVINGPSARVDGAEVTNSTVKALKDGRVVAVPTDTIYGLACLAQNSNAIKKVLNVVFYPCGGRYCKVSVKKELIGDLLPGPVTLVLERAEVLNTDLNPFTPLVVVCIPDQAFMRRLCQMCREPLAVTSANISSHSSTVAVHDFQDLWPQLSVVVDGGPIGDKSRLGSTGKYRIIRPGCAFSSTVHVLEHKYGLSEDTG
uniref:Threonylcarbamoyl-AMP synthase n=1 Tax=Oncorhynchus mykiss TaxID=8022 RepID=A0A8C7SJE0_ONCMY